MFNFVDAVEDYSVFGLAGVFVWCGAFLFAWYVICNLRRFGFYRFLFLTV